MIPKTDEEAHQRTGLLDEENGDKQTRQEVSFLMETSQNSCN